MHPFPTHWFQSLKPFPAVIIVFVFHKQLTVVVYWLMKYLVALKCGALSCGQAPLLSLGHILFPQCWHWQQAEVKIVKLPVCQGVSWSLLSAASDACFTSSLKVHRCQKVFGWYTKAQLPKSMLEFIHFYMLILVNNKSAVSILLGKNPTQTLHSCQGVHEHFMLIF